MDDRAARYAELDDITVVGLIEGDWPERARRGIFYGPALLGALGWPSEKDRRAGADARFVDLLDSPSRYIALSTFTLDEDALVEPSTQLEDIGRAVLTTVVGDVARPRSRVTKPGSRATTPESSEAARIWAEMRMARSPSDAPAFHGSAGEQAPRAWSVSALETYLGCPFQFFARHILRLEEEPDEEEVMDPKAQGRFIHGVFEDFFREWQAAGGRTITPENLDRARETFASVVDRSVERLPAAEAALERTRLVGSSVAAGLGE